MPEILWNIEPAVDECTTQSRGDGICPPLVASDGGQTEVHGCRVTGIDLSAEFCETAQQMSRWVGLSDKVTFISCGHEHCCQGRSLCGRSPRTEAGPDIRSV